MEQQNIILTFDDGPHLERTPRILEALDQVKAKAVFFVVGSRLDCRAGMVMVERVLQRGHAIGNHSFSHVDLTKVNRGRIRDEILKTETRLKDYLGEVKLFRPPYGARNALIDELIRDLGYRIVLWDVDSRDWEVTCAGESWLQITVRETKRALEKGRNITILCHDTKVRTAQGVGRLLDQLQGLDGANLGRDHPGVLLCRDR